DPIILAMLAFFEAGSLVTYFIILQLLYYEGEKSRLEYQEVLNQSQYKNLSRRIDETRKARHDIRHHFLVLDTLAKEEDLPGIRNYLSQFAEKQASSSVLVYCEHFATNALLSYYSEQAEEEGIKFSAKCNIPSEIGISNKDLTIILSNLLENAMNACRKVTDAERMIQMTGRYEDAGLTLRIKNTSLAAPKVDKNGRYISTSHSGYGVGVESVQAIVKKYNGAMKMDFDGEVVSVSIMLMV
ncbi:MAG: ATP-binding protein, partial [Eubacteriales bacterium]|nr:ATP-binding protein [Eubacteriales bacterium]